MTEPRVTVDLARQHGLRDGEYERVVRALGRTPTYTELGVISVMWSEHCSYRSSRRFLKTLPTTGARVIEGPGENAGVIDAGDGIAIAFKMESHNHPSFIEPRQGAATGVGGILRDIFTMNTRPIALLDALRFGRLDHPVHGAKNRYLFEGVVSGISSYGNAIGVPTVAGDVRFDDGYANNPLVNVMAVGVGRSREISRARAGGVGNPVIYLGARTGRDGIHGATMASAGFDETSEERRPTVQVGDPFMEKLVLEATLEVLKTGVVVGIQDMGAAGLTCSTVEMAHKGGCGIELILDRVPQREPNMTPYELMLSESQERMFLVAEAGREGVVKAVAEKWGLNCEVVGRVIEEPRARVVWRGTVVVDLPTALVVDEAPQDDLAVNAFEPAVDGVCAPAVWDTASLLAKLGDPTTASKEWVFRQYDHTVRAGTVVPPGAADAGVVRIPGTRRALAVAVGSNVFDAALAVACVGAEPVAITNCLNFGNPRDALVLTDFARAVDGIGRNCRALGIPVTGGNVSLYNETDGVAIPPTPIIGMLGLIDDLTCAVTAGWKAAGDEIALLSSGPDDQFDAGRMVKFLVRCARERLISSAHDVGEDGLEVALAEACMLSPLRGDSETVPVVTGSGGPGVASRLSPRGLGARCRAASRARWSLQVVVSVSRGSKRFLDAAEACNVGIEWIGTVGGDRLLIERGAAPAIDVPLDSLELAWRGAIPRQMKSAREVG